MPGTATPEATTSTAGRRIPAAQPSGLRGQALPRPRFKVVAMAAPVRGRGDARPPLRVPARRPCRVPQPLNGRLGPGISSDRAMVHVAGKRPSAIRGDAWHRNPKATTSATGRRTPAAQPSGLRCRHCLVGDRGAWRMATARRGRGDAPCAPACDEPTGRPPERLFRAWRLLRPRAGGRSAPPRKKDIP
jgi:hypothetical protein